MVLQNFRVLSLDATNTLIRLKRPPAETYARFANEFGFFDIDQKAVTESFLKGFKELEITRPCYGFYADGAKSWWTDLMRICYGQNIAKNEKFEALASRVFDYYRTKDAWCLTNEQVILTLLTFSLIHNFKNLNLLRSFASYGLKISVVSNFDHRLYEILDAFELTNLIDYVLISGNIGFQKPDPRIFKLLFDHFQIEDPKSFLHIGDNYKKDYLPAIELGMNALLLAEKHPDVPSSNCIRCISDLNKFLK